MHISKSKMCFNEKSSAYYFHLKTKALADFQICISVPLNIFLRAVRTKLAIPTHNFALTLVPHSIFAVQVFFHEFYQNPSALLSVSSNPRFFENIS